MEQQALTQLDDDTIVNTTTMASLLGLTVRRVQQLIQDGILQTEKKGRLFLIDNVQRYISYAGNGRISKEEQKLEMLKKAADVKIKKARAEILLLESEELKGNFHRSEDVETITTDLVMTIRSMLTALPGRLAVEVAQHTSAEECSIIIKDQINGVLKALSDYEYNPKKYEERVRQRRAWAEAMEEALEESDAE
jgi:phage terminase Nu1 subunit (DNA packaging protein)